MDVGKPFNGISLQAFEKRSTIIRMVLLPWELCRSVAMAMCDHRHCGNNRGDISCSGVRDCMQTVQASTCSFPSVARDGHQKVFLSSCVVLVMPGCPELKEVNPMYHSKGGDWGVYCLPEGHAVRLPLGKILRG